MIRYELHRFVATLGSAVAMCLAALSSSANAQQAYMLAGDGMSTSIALVDLTSGSVSGSVTSSTPLNSLVRAADGTFYGMDASGQLDAVDPTTGATTPIGTANGLYYPSLMSDGSNVYVFDENGNASLYSLDTTTGSVAAIGPPKAFAGNAYASSGDNALFTVIRSGDPSTPLYSVDTGTGLPSPIGSGTGATYLRALVSVSGTMYAADDSGQVFSINTVSGVATATGASFSSYINSLGMMGQLYSLTPVPEAATNVAMLIGAAGLGLMVRRRKSHQRAAGAQPRDLKHNVLPDFFIGAHAATQNLPLLTRDARRYTSYFSRIRLITPS